MKMTVREAAEKATRGLIRKKHRRWAQEMQQHGWTVTEPADDVARTDKPADSDNA